MSHRQANWREWSWLMFWGLFTHPILDCFTTWGTQLFWPYATKIAFNSVFVIDPLYTLPFLFFLILALRLKRTDLKRKKYNYLGLVISSAYLVLTVILKGVAFMEFKDSLKGQQINYERLDTRPAPLNSILWNANVEIDDAFLIGDYSFLDDNTNIRFETFPKNHHYLGTLINDVDVKRLIDISNGWFTISRKDGVLYFNDLWADKSV